MKLEKQVVSLDLAKRLEELGVNQDSYFEWRDVECYGNRQWELHETDCADCRGAAIVHETYAAFTVAEVISMLQEVAQEDIIVAWSDDNVAGHLAKQLCTKLQNSKESVGSGHTQ